MARYLLLEFDDDAQADALRAKIDAATSSGKRFRVVGMFQRPTKWCNCLRSTSTYKDWNIQRGAKYGWWVCPDCRRPIVGDHQMKNLIDPGQVINPFSSIGRAFHSTANPSNSDPRRYLLRFTELLGMVWPAK